MNPADGTAACRACDQHVPFGHGRAREYNIDGAKRPGCTEKQLW